MNQSPILLKYCLFLFLITSYNVFSHTDGHKNTGKQWSLYDNTQLITADYITFSKQMVFLKETKSNAVITFPLMAFSMEDQVVILEHHELTQKLNKEGALNIKLHPTTTKIRKTNGKLGLLFLLFCSAYLILYFRFAHKRKIATMTLFCVLSLILIIACSQDDEELSPAPNTTNTSPSSTETTNNSTSDTTEETTDDSTAEETTSSEESSHEGVDLNESLLETIISHFEKFTEVTINSDDEYFYVNSYSWPEHEMGIGITSWQEQVPIPQNYTGDNSWRIPLNPKMAVNPVDTSVNLFRGAIAIAINGIPIFNALNNRGENAFEKGELDNWGGHFGRGDDYHYHMIPLHLEELVGTNQPLAYGLDGFPIYGLTDSDLDQAFGRYDENGSYRYHASSNSPYYMPYVVGEINIVDDEISPQPSQNPIRPSDTFKPVSGASITGFSQTGVNTFSFEYTVDGVKYYVNYNWDENCKFTFTYVDENGGTTNLPHNGSLSDDSTENTETFVNNSACIDVNYNSSIYVNHTEIDETFPSNSGETDGFSVTSENSNFTLSSIAIDDGGALLDAYKCEEKVQGVEKSIPIAWSNIPEGTRSLAISIHGFPNANETNSYLTLWNIDPSVTEISYGLANDGTWYMGPNKDGATISYSSPCSPSGATSTYYLTIYALSETPPSLPEEDSLTIDYTALIASFEEVTIIDQIVLEYIATSSN